MNRSECRFRDNFPTLRLIIVTVVFRLCQLVCHGETVNKIEWHQKQTEAFKYMSTMDLSKGSSVGRVTTGPVIDIIVRDSVRLACRMGVFSHCYVRLFTFHLHTSCKPNVGKVQNSFSTWFCG